MFLIFGINQKEKQLEFDQVVICNSCGKYGHITVWMTYSYFMLFFIPLFKWGRHYFVKMSCCGAVGEISQELGEKIASGRLHTLAPEDLPFEQSSKTWHRCSKCGYTTDEDFEYCPKCGSKLE